MTLRNQRTASRRDATYIQNLYNPPTAKIFHNFFLGSIKKSVSLYDEIGDSVPDGLFVSA